MKNYFKNNSLFFIVCFLFLSLSCFVFGAQVDDAEKYGGTLTIAAAKDPLTLDPSMSNDLATTLVCDQIYDTLVTFDSNMDIIPHIALSWESNDTSDVWTFKIREGVKFHDGTLLTSEDVAYSFQRVIDNPKANAGKKSRVSMISDINTPDKYTVVFYLKSPYSPFLGTARQEHIVPKHIAEKEDIADKMIIGSGPFKFVEWQRDQHIILERNDGYWLRKPYLERVVFRPIPDSTIATMSVMAGEVDVVEEITAQAIPQLEKNPNVRVEISEGMNYHWVGFRQFGDPYKDARFRKMVYYSTDFDQLVDTLFLYGTGVRAYTPVSPGVWARDLEYLKSIALKQDHNKAKELFDELVSEGKMKKDTPIIIRVDEQPWRVKIAEVIVTNLQEIGINAKMESLEWSAYLDYVLRSETPGLFVLGTVPTVVDPDAVFHWLYSTSGQYGKVIFGKDIEKTKADEWIDKARQIVDREERENLYRKVARWAIEEEVIDIPVYHQNVKVAIGNRVHDLLISPIYQWRLTTSFANVWVEKK